MGLVILFLASLSASVLFLKSRLYTLGELMVSRVEWFSKMYSLLPIMYILMSSIANDRKIWPGLTAHVRKRFHFQKNRRDRKNLYFLKISWMKHSFYFKEQSPTLNIFSRPPKWEKCFFDLDKEKLNCFSFLVTFSL